MMDKKSNAGIPCTFCDRDALPDTNPPACELHTDKDSGLRKEGRQDEPRSVKELLNAD